MWAETSKYFNSRFIQIVSWWEIGLHISVKSRSYKSGIFSKKIQMIQNSQVLQSFSEVKIPLSLETSPLEVWGSRNFMLNQIPCSILTQVMSSCCIISWWSGSFPQHQSHIWDIRMCDNYAPLKRAAPYKSDCKHWLVLHSKWNYCELGAAPEHVPSCSLVIGDVNISD